MSATLTAHLAIPEWRKKLEQSLKTHQHQVQSRYIQLATCCSKGQARVRTVVYRGFIENSNLLSIHTDLRSDKCTQLSDNPRCEINWYFTESREQYRITGKASLITENSTDYQVQRRWHWQQLSAVAKADYNKAVPGIPLPEMTADANHPAALSKYQMTEPHNNFVLLIVRPESVDHVMLLPSPHQRVMHELDSQGRWHETAITP